MRRLAGANRWWAAGLLPLWAAWAAFALGTIPQVPFHPDEASHIYLSADFDRLIYQLDPAGVTWQTPDVPEDVRRYRLLEAPLSRYLIGLGRGLLGQGGNRLSVDWNWSATWDANAQAGAVPDMTLLTAARLPATVMTLLVPLLLFALGQRLTNPAGGIAAAVLFAFSGLALLHGRRAMSEGPLLFSVVLAAWLSLRIVPLPDRPGEGNRKAGSSAGEVHWTRAAALGAVTAIAASAKLTGWLALPLTLAAVAASSGGKLRRLALHTGVLLLSLMIATLVLSPALWAAPVRGLQAMAAAREDLLARQTSALQEAGAGFATRGPAERLAAQLYHTFLAPLAYWDIANYAVETGAAETAYGANWLNTGLRFEAATPRLVAGAVFLTLCLAGVALAGLRWVRAKATIEASAVRWSIILLGVWSAATAATTLAFGIAWQRYYLPLLPVACVWAGHAVGEMAGRLSRFRRRETAVEG